MSRSLSIKNELMRKSIHICNSLFAYSLFFFNQRDFAIAIGICTIGIILFEIARVKSRKVSTFFIKIFGPIIRDFEGGGRLTGATYVMVSSFFVLLFFDKYVCITSILIMSYSDTAAAIIGKMYGKTKIFKKTLEGSLAFFITSLIIILVMVPEVNFGLGLVAILAATIVESLPISIDDNLSVPLIIALILSI
ncbi:MAG: hypothetical protein CMG13_02700 [Candidatus Marinimicrobia bacterium]|nr:hypothetical protein [Candidatus Neomarinimicrobiota bacterium]